MAATIKDIAERANVGPTAVSLALRGLAGVSQAKREEIKEIARQMGYRPSFFGRGLQGGRTQSIGILWSLWGHPSAQLVRDLTFRALRRNYISYVIDSLSDPGIIDRTLDEFSRRRVDAMIMYCPPGEVPEALSRFPVAVAVGREAWQGDIDYIHYDHCFGIRQMARHFLAKGRTRPVALCNGKVNRFKSEAFLEEFCHNGVRVDEDSLVMIPENESKVTVELLQSVCGSRLPNLDCLFGSTDVIAAVAMKWLAARGVRIPEDVAVGGFNDEDMSRLHEPALASVGFNNVKLADAIDNLVMTRLEGPDTPVRNQVVPFEFVARASAG